MLLGVMFGMAAGMLWGLVFICPLLLPEYPATLQSFGRYLAFGLIALPIAWLDRAELKRLSRADWIEALKLGAVGNILYYMLLATGIQRAGGPLPTMIIGTLPIVISICSNLRNHQRDGHLPWRKLLPSLLLVGFGIALVNQAELTALASKSGVDYLRYLSGAMITLGAVICWTWYPLRNADWLLAHPDHKPRAWATAQGIATLPLAWLGYLLLSIWFAAHDNPFPMPFGPRPIFFVSLMIAMGILASWLGTLCWNEASQRLTTAVVGQLIVFETLAALAYAFILRGQWPDSLTTFGIVLLMVGVLWGTRIRPVNSKDPND